MTPRSVGAAAPEPTVPASWFRIASFPDRTLGNPGLELFYGGLGDHGVTLSGRCTPTGRWVRRHAGEIDAIHLHWPEKLWRGRPRGRLDRAVRTATFAPLRGVFALRRALHMAGRLGVKRLWTVHNIEPHDGARWLDRTGYRLVAREADLIICYSMAAADRVRRLYEPSCEVVAIPHGNYCGFYPPPRPREEVMRQIGLDPARPLVCCVGLIRAYKGLDTACEAVTRLTGDVQLAICGVPRAREDVAALRTAMRRLPGVLIDRALSDQEFADVIAASECVLLPYRNITGSGSLLAAWSLGRGVVASDLPLFREMLSPEPGAGVLFRPGNAEHMASAIASYLAVPAAERSAAARRIAQQYEWTRTVQPLVQVLRQWKTR